MNKPIDQTWFWNERILEAKKRGREHFSVYITKDTDWARIEEAHRKILSREIQKGMKVLDAGCGYGRSSEWFPPKEYTYVGTDFSPDFIREAQQKYSGRRFIQGNLKSLPFGALEFDIAFCISIRQMVMDNLGNREWEAMEKELKRVAKKVLILEYEEPEPYWIL